jgi:hypothetical protein
LDLVAAAVAVLTACSDPSPGPCIGDCSLPIVVQPMGVYEYEPHDLVDGDPVSIDPPLQGGYVLYVGVRAQNVHGQTTRLTAAVRDPAGPRVVSIEQRPVRLLAGGDGWARPESQYQDLANVAVCSVPEAVDFDQAVWRVELQLIDADGRRGETSVLIRPRCGADDGFGCACACDSERPAGGGCAVDPLDAGVDAAQ